MNSIKRVIEYLCKSDDVGFISTTQIVDTSLPLEGVKQDWEAKKGDISWISPKVAKKFPERIRSFKGSLLICPDGLDEKLLQANALIICKNPKIAFIKVLGKFFMHLAETRWPKLGENSIANDAQIGSNVNLSNGVVIGPGVIIADDVFIGPNTVIANCTINRNVSIGANCSIGLPGFGYEKDQEGIYRRFPHIGRVLIQESVEIGSNTCIDRGALGNTIIRKFVKIDNLVHIAHNVEIGENSIVIANSMLGGSAKIKENVWVSPSVSIMNQIEIASSALLGMGSVVIKAVPSHAVVVGNPAKQLRKGHKNE